MKVPAVSYPNLRVLRGCDVGAIAQGQKPA